MIVTTMYLGVIIWSKNLFTPFFYKNLIFFIWLTAWKLGPWYYTTQGTWNNTIRIKGWTEEWEEERHTKNDAVSKAMFVSKYKDTVFDLPHADNNTFYVRENEIAWVWGQDGGWTIFGVCDVVGVEEEKLTPFLAISLIWLKQQKEAQQEKGCYMPLYSFFCITHVYQIYHIPLWTP